MSKTVTVTAYYPEGDADALFAAALDFAEVQEAMRGLAVYEGVTAGPIVQGDTMTVDVTFWGIIKSKGHVMFVETLDPDARLIQSREHNPKVKTWDHTLKIDPNPDGGAIWVDRIVIDAGWQTWAMARFAAYMYQRRHKHRHAAKLTAHIS